MTPVRVLAVDDERSILDVVSRALAPHGCTVASTTDPAEALRLADVHPFDLVIADLSMPGMSGIELIERLHAAHPSLGVVLMTGHVHYEAALKAIKCSEELAGDYLLKPFEIAELVRVVFSVLEIARRDARVADFRQGVAALSASCAAGGTNLLAHHARVAALAAAIAQELSLDMDATVRTEIAALVHDVGIPRVPGYDPSGSLLEYDSSVEAREAHVRAGVELLRRRPFRGPIPQIVEQHHAHVDGTGFPAGLTGDAMHREAKIVAVADAADVALLRDPLRRIDSVMTRLAAGRGTVFDREAANACMELLSSRRFVPDPI